jgi:two-component system nitrate/nitrite response regulator NarL
VPDSRTVPGRSTAPIRVVLVDDHQMLLEALGAALAASADIEVIGVAASLADLRELKVGRPDVVLMDYHLPDGTGADGCRLAKARWPQVRVVILTGAGQQEAAVASVTSGADGFLIKAGRLVVLIEAIKTAFARHPVLSPEVLGELARQLQESRTESTSARTAPDPLTPRELTVLRALSLGRSTGDIASELALSQGTVRVHVEAIRRKFHASSRLEAVSSAIAFHIVEVPAC